MSSKSEFNNINKKFDLFPCPFMDKCVLKKIETCEFPGFYTCPEYQGRKQKLLK